MNRISKLLESFKYSTTSIFLSDPKQYKKAKEILTGAKIVFDTEGEDILRVSTVPEGMDDRAEQLLKRAGIKF